MKETYSIEELARMSGLSTRTIRNYLKLGILCGDKSSGKWQFSGEQVEAFFAHPTVSPSIQAKRNGVVLDFLSGGMAKNNQICVMLDLPEEDGEAVSAYFLAQLETGAFGSDFSFSFADTDRYPRVILRGRMQEIVRLLYHFAQTREETGEAR